MLRLDWLDYAERLLGSPDWSDPASVAALIAKAQALLPSDVLALPVARVATAHIAARAALHSAVAAKPGGAAPLKALLADAQLAAVLNDTLVRLAAGCGGALLALELPAPAAMAQAVAVAAGLPAPAVDEDLADDAAVYVAAFLRNFAGAPVGALLIGEDARFEAFAAPVLKVAAHYGWRTDFKFSEQQLFDASGPRPNVGWVAVSIPADAAPEAVAAAVARLREAA